MQSGLSSDDPQCALQKENAQRFHPMCKTLVWQTAVARFNQCLPAELEFQALKRLLGKFMACANDSFKHTTKSTR